MSLKHKLMPVRESGRRVGRIFRTFQLFNFAIFILATAAALSAQAVQIELLTNGYGSTLDGWTNASSYSGGAFEIETKYDASWFASSCYPCSLSQVVTLTDCGLTEGDIQSNPTVTASGIVIAADQKDDCASRICNVKVYELDASGNTLATHVIMDRVGEVISTPAAFTNTFSLGSSTRKLKYEMNGQDNLIWAGTYGPKFRNCSLKLTINNGVQLWQNGPFWAADNVGAVSPEDYGYYFWWGDTIGYRRENNAYVASDGSSSDFSFEAGNAATYGKTKDELISAGYIDAAGKLVAAYDAATAHLGPLWRLPSNVEFQALVDNCTATWTTRNGVNGYLVAGKGAYADKSIFLPAAGRAGEKGFYNYPENNGFYWASERGNSSSQHWSYGLNFKNDNFGTYSYPRERGQSVRAVTSAVKFTFVSEGTAVDTMSYLIGGDAAQTAPSASRESYRFKGYYTAETGGVQIFDENRVLVQSSQPNLTLNMTLYARWELETVNFTFMSDGLEIGRVTYQIESATTPEIPNADRESYSFQGYYTQESGGVQVFDENYAFVQDSLSSLTPNVTLYAHLAAMYTFNFVSTDATVGSDEYTEGGTVNAPIPQRAGDYIFQGYYTDNGVQVFDASGALVEGALSGLPLNISLYAHWGVPEGSIAKLVYRGQLNLLTGEAATHSGSYTKTMHFRVYDGEETTTPLWSIDNQSVTVNADGSFVHAFGDEDLAALLATGRVTHVGLAIGPTAGLATELKPRRELRPVAAVNRALTAEGAAPDIRIGNLVTENALVAANATVSQLEVAGTVNAPGAGNVKVSPLTVGPGERTRLLRGKGVRVFSKEKPQTLPLSISGAVLRGQVIATAPSDGIALISSSGSGQRALRCPAVVQYCKEGDKIRAPTSDEGGLKVTFFPFVGNEGK